MFLKYSRNSYAVVFKGNTETLECRVSKDLEIIFHGWDFYPSNPNRSLIENIDANSRFGGV